MLLLENAIQNQRTRSTHTEVFSPERGGKRKHPSQGKPRDYSRHDPKLVVVVRVWWCGCVVVVVWCVVSVLCVVCMWCCVVLCGVVWCGVVWCGVVWCGVVWCGVVWCGVVWCGVVWCGGVGVVVLVVAVDLTWTLASDVFMPTAKMHLS